MKKNLYWKVLAMALVLASFYAVYTHSQQEEPLSDFVLANVEALANGESGGMSGCCWSPNSYCMSSDGVILYNHRSCHF